MYFNPNGAYFQNKNSLKIVDIRLGSKLCFVLNRIANKIWLKANESFVFCLWKQKQSSCEMNVKRNVKNLTNINTIEMPTDKL